MCGDWLLGASREDYNPPFGRYRHDPQCWLMRHGAPFKCALASSPSLPPNATAADSSEVRFEEVADPPGRVSRQTVDMIEGFSFAVYVTTAHPEEYVVAPVEAPRLIRLCRQNLALSAAARTNAGHVFQPPSCATACS
jgi:hypothetical protein